MLNARMFSDARLLRVLAYGSVISTYILILIGGYVTTSGAGAACGSSSGANSWPLCNGSIFPKLSNQAQVIEYTHRVFNVVVAFFVVGTAIVAWTKYNTEKSVVLFSTASFLGLFGQVILGMITVTSDLNPVVGAAHLGLASALLAVVVVNAVMVSNLRRNMPRFNR
ncbi:MAG TPA: COX15/CtaA family protein [Candidatus Dormibacteraeota bacterium]|nr:COX15/CtaA family protein [Candidatus Dormibacteraeota bacterium]